MWECLCTAAGYETWGARRSADSWRGPAASRPARRDIDRFLSHDAASRLGPGAAGSRMLPLSLFLAVLLLYPISTSQHVTLSYTTLGCAHTSPDMATALTDFRRRSRYRAPGSTGGRRGHLLTERSSQRHLPTRRPCSPGRSGRQLTAAC